MQLLKGVYEGVNQYTTEYYGSSVTDAIGGASNSDGVLLPYYSRIDKLYNDGEISIELRDRRKEELRKNYVLYTDHKISCNDYQNIKEQLINP